MMREEFMTMLYQKEVANVARALQAQTVGDYTKNYETAKRAQNILCLYRKELARLPGAVSVLDLGCSIGLYAFLMSQIGASRDIRVYGVDQSASEIQFARELKHLFGVDNVFFDLGDVKRLSFNDYSFDIILCAEVIEHIQAPDHLFSEIIRVLKPGGMVILTTPNKSNFFLRFKRRRRRIDQDEKMRREDSRAYTPCDDHGHVSVKGLNAWIDIIKHSGFVIEQIRRGALFRGGAKYDSHPCLFGFGLILDRLLDFLPFCSNVTENLTFQLRKPNGKKK